MLNLQRTAGNQATAGLLRSSRVPASDLPPGAAEQSSFSISGWFYSAALGEGALLAEKRLGSGLREFRGGLTSGVALSGHSRGDIYGTLDVLELKKAAHGW